MTRVGVAHFFFQAEDGIRDYKVNGVQTCALPILPAARGQHVSGLPEDRNSELRALFFESAGELLQSLNEAGLDLEANPADEEVIRRVRRAVHTLKGDSAACGFHKLSELAHELEDAL